jgi:hypothetical protein
VGTVTPLVAGQRVKVTLRRRGRPLRAFRAPIKQLGSGARGRFVVRFRIRRPGRLTIVARHGATAAQQAFAARLRVVVRPR